MKRDRLFLRVLATLALGYVSLVVAMLVADVIAISPSAAMRALADPVIRYAAVLSLLTATLAAVLSLVVAVPAGYLLSRRTGRWWRAVELAFDVPIVLPPLVIGLSLLVLFQSSLGRLIESAVAGLGVPGIGGVAFEIPAIVLAQFVVGAAFATRAMRATFDEQTSRAEDVARTLGHSQSQAFLRVTLPQSRRGLVNAGSLAWSRCLGEFGPVIVFAGTTRFKTEVLPTSVFLQLNVGDLQGALATALLLVLIATIVLALTRSIGGRP